MTQSTSYLMIRKDAKRIRAHKGKFERKVGDKLNIDGFDYYVFALEPSLEYAAIRLNMFAYNLHLDLARTELAAVGINL